MILSKIIRFALLQSLLHEGISQEILSKRKKSLQLKKNLKLFQEVLFQLKHLKLQESLELFQEVFYQLKDLKLKKNFKLLAKNFKLSKSLKLKLSSDPRTFA